MPRYPRSHLPGAVFHLTARTLGRRGRFSEVIRSQIERDIAAVFARSDARLLAYCVMSNHLHLVIRQGQKPLDRCMKPLLRRVALRAQRAHRTTGHIFEGRFRDSACLDPHYIRNAIVYTNLNPVRAGLVDAPGQYVWSSHGSYSRDDPASGRRAGPLESVLAAELGLTLFAPTAGADRGALRASYDRFVAWRLECDLFEGYDAGSERPEPPPLWGGQDPWARRFPEFATRPDFAGADLVRARRRQRTDLSDIAKRMVAELRLDLDLDLIRSGCKTRVIARARRDIVLRAHDAGHPNHVIARYLRVSPQCVSTIIVGR